MVPARLMEAVDTTGAGDAFNGGFVTGISEGMDLFAAAEFGNMVASLSVQKFGTAPSMPLREEIDKARIGKAFYNERMKRCKSAGIITCAAKRFW